MTTVRPLSLDDAPACDAIVAGLPYFFGDPQGIRDCADAVRTQEGWASIDDGQVTGFLTLERRFPESAEITWLAVRAGRRRGGRGRALVETACREASASGCRVLSVLTLGSTVQETVEDGYAGTRLFYKHVGFLPVNDFALASWNSTAHLMVRLL